MTKGKKKGKKEITVTKGKSPGPVSVGEPTLPWILGQLSEIHQAGIIGSGPFGQKCLQLRRYLQLLSHLLQQMPQDVKCLHALAVVVAAGRYVLDYASSIVKPTERVHKKVTIRFMLVIWQLEKIIGILSYPGMTEEIESLRVKLAGALDQKQLSLLSYFSSAFNEDFELEVKSVNNLLKLVGVKSSEFHIIGELILELFSNTKGLVVVSESKKLLVESESVKENAIEVSMTDFDDGAKSDEVDKEDTCPNYFCTAMCDHLFNVSKSKYDPEWDDENRQMLFEILERCNMDEDDHWKKHTNSIEEEDTFTIDIRGKFMNDGIQSLSDALHRCSTLSHIMYLNIVVGCKKHGVGSGYLKEKIARILSENENVSSTFHDYYFSIKLEPDKLISLMSHGYSTHFDVLGGMKEDLFTVSCEFIFEHNDIFEIEPKKKLLESERSHTTSYKYQKGSYIQGGYLNKTVELLASHIACWVETYADGKLKGFMLHSFGEGEFREKIIEMLHDKCFEWSEVNRGCLLIKHDCGVGGN